MLLKGNLHPKMFSYGYILPRNYISHIFEFQLVPFPFSFILGDPFMVFLSPLKYGEGELFPKNTFHGETNFVGNIYRWIVLHGRTNYQNIPMGRSFTKCIF